MAKLPIVLLKFSGLKNVFNIILKLLRTYLNPSMENAKTVEEWASVLGEQMRALRLRANLDQISLAERAGIGLTALKNLESGKGATVSTLIKALRALDRDAWLSSLAPAVSISPLQLLKAKPARQRASRPRSEEAGDHG
jgi:transcriptional regulator with XRE-family HTH domain